MTIDCISGRVDFGPRNFELCPKLGTPTRWGQFGRNVAKKSINTFKKFQTCSHFFFGLFCLS